MAHVRNFLFLFILSIMIGCGEVRDSLPQSNYPNITTNIQTLDKADPKEAIIVDGDTIKLEFDGKLTTIRLIGIDSFETKKNDKAYRQAYQNGHISIEEVLERGERAKAYIKALLSKRIENYLAYDEDFLDRYGRTLAYVWFDDHTMLNMKLICDGYAFPLTIQPNDKYAKQFQNCYEEAKAAHRGIWR